MYLRTGSRRLINWIGGTFGTSVRAVLLLSLVISLIISTATTLLILDLRARDLNRAKETIDSLSRVLSDQTTRAFDSILLTMRSTRERLSDDIGNRLELDNLLVHYLLQVRTAGLPQVKSIFLVDSEGRGVNSSRPDFVRNLSMQTREFFRYHADGGENEIFISPAEQAKVDGQHTYYVSIPLRDAKGNFRGVVAAAMNIEYFEALYQTISQKSASQILLLNESGKRLAGTPRDNARYGVSEGDPATLEQLAAQRGGAIKTAIGPTGQRRFTVYQRIVNYPLNLSVSIDERDALDSWRHTAQSAVAGALFMQLFILVVALALLKNLRRKEKLEARLKERDEQIWHMVQSVRDAIVTADPARRIVLFNGAAERLFDMKATEAIGSPFEELVYRRLDERQHAWMRRQLDEAWHSPTGFTMLTNIELRQDERNLPVEVSLSSTAFHGGILLTAVFRDLSESQRAARELLETNRQLQELSAAQRNVREEERIAIARELHDELGQLLTGIRLEISWLKRRLPPERSLESDKVASIKRQIDHTIATVRRISSELRPLVLDDLGLSAAAAWYVNQFSNRTGLATRLDLPEENPVLGGAVATALFRILQESLTNIARHAQASTIDITLTRDSTEWTLSIADDGKGFVYDPSRRGSLGLIGMRERAQVLGGRFSIVSSPGKGTVIQAAIPIERGEGSDEVK
ncbi:MAG: cache domain-containing protein [Azospira sp.]|jgi:PAS domain S-box-containing protein|nr:cache domain-containing protein [Azospira sp.]